MPHLFQRVALVGIGLIGSSLARVIKREGMASRVVCADTHPAHRETALSQGVVDEAFADVAEAVAKADLVLLCVPVSACAEIARRMAPVLQHGCIVSDTGSVKSAVIQAVSPHLPPSAHFVPAHPIAGTENSGPEAGFADLFKGRWCILTPLPATDAGALAKVRDLWERAGAKVDVMSPAHHDRVLALTSHLPHLIAYTIVDTAATLEGDLQSEVIRYSAGGFRDFTRIAASDPTMWRDIFLSNREAVLEVAQRLTEDLMELQKAIRRGDGEKLFDVFTRARALRRCLLPAGPNDAAPADIQARPKN